MSAVSSGPLLLRLLDDLDAACGQALSAVSPGPRAEEIGRVFRITGDVAWCSGLAGVGSEELLLIGGKVPCMALEILEDRVGVVLLDRSEELSAGLEVARAGRILDVPVGDGLLGRIVDPLGRPRDRAGAIRGQDRLPVQREAPPIMSRAPVTVALQTGLKVVDALFPIGRGQRELILGDRQTGKTAVALDAIINQRETGVACVYCAIGQRSSSVAKAVDELSRHDAMKYTCVVVVEGDEPAGLQYIAPYAATSMAEHWMAQGRDVLIVYDDLTRHAWAYRQLSLLLRRPPGREAFPGDVFYIHSRLLERATRMREEFGGGSLTALPIIETEAQNISAYIPTNLISITDGQLYLSPELFQRGVLPAIDAGLSVSRVGGKAQEKAYRRVAGDLRLSYTQFQELESFSRFGTRLDDETRAKLEHGRRVREILKQDRSSPLSSGDQIAALYAVTEGLMDKVPLGRVHEAELALVNAARERLGDLQAAVVRASADDPVWEHLRVVIQEALAGF